MAMAMGMGVAGQHGEHPSMSWWDAPLKHRKWRGKGASQGFDRYNKSMKVIEQGQGQGYDPPRLKDLRKQNRLRTRRFYGKKRGVPRSVPRAPYNDSSFLMKVRRSGGLEKLVSPSPSDAFSSPACSSYKLGAYEPVVDQNDYGYGSMTGLIHLRPTEDGDRSSGSTVDNNSFDDMCVEQPPVSSADSALRLEQRLDRDVSRFEMTPLPERTSEYLMEQRVTRQDVDIAQLEDENLVLKERLFLVQQEVGELRQRLQGGERCCVDESDENDDDGAVAEELADVHKNSLPKDKGSLLMSNIMWSPLACTLSRLLLV